MKIIYRKPAVDLIDLALLFSLMGLSAPDEGIHDGGEGSDDDDPDSKRRKKGSWNSIW